MDKKKIGSAVLVTVLIILCFPILLFGFICYAFYKLLEWLNFPERKKYKSSAFYREYGGKYYLGVMKSHEMRWYETVKKRALPVTLSFLKTEDGYVWLEYFRTEKYAYLVRVEMDGFYVDDGEWFAETEFDDEGKAAKTATLSDYLSEEQKRIEEKDGVSLLGVKILAEEDDFEESVKRKAAEGDGRFFIYKLEKACTEEAVADLIDEALKSEEVA